MSHEDSLDDPYPPGAVFEIRAHTPPSIAAANKQHVSAAEHELNSDRELYESVFRFPSPPTAQVANPKILRLSIVEIISTGRSQNAQLVLCNVCEPQGKDCRKMVAKIYDPLYRTSEWRERPISFTKEANVNYSREAAAYQRIEAHRRSLPPACTPKYYGSWCFDVTETPTSTSTRPQRACRERTRRKRTICLVLLEHISSHCLGHIVPYSPNLVDLNEEDRLRILAALIDIDTWLKHIGIQHNDMKPRNMMIDPPPILHDPEPGQTKPTVTLIDFGESEVGDAAEESLPPSPVATHWTGWRTPLDLLCPRWWMIDLPRRRRWLLEQFGGSDRYQKVLDLGNPEIVTEVDKFFLQNLGLTKKEWRRMVLKRELKLGRHEEGGLDTTAQSSH